MTLTDEQIEAIRLEWDGVRGTVPLQKFAMKYIPALLSALEAEKKRADDAEALAERLKREAVQHAQEARTANATIAEAYQAVTGGAGEPGNWHGAEPIIAEITRLHSEIERYREALKLAAEMLTKASLCDDERLDEGLSVIRRALTENGHDKG
jgi:hypothetical protein